MENNLTSKVQFVEPLPYVVQSSVSGAKQGFKSSTISNYILYEFCGSAKAGATLTIKGTDQLLFKVKKELLPCLRSFTR